MQKRPISDIAFGTLGLVVGLLLAYLISIPLYQLTIPVLGSLVSLLIYVVLGHLGIKLATTKRGELSEVIKGTGSHASKLLSPKDKTKLESATIPKVLDTSVIIDGRIADIARIGFLEGPLLVPVFVLGELQHIADSADSQKRNRGRRGLDILNKMQELDQPKIIITEEPYEDILEVDAKILKKAKDVGGVVVTNDYNLNKVAKVQGIAVLNVNDLANAVKPVVIPGEEMTVHVVKEGKEAGQGLAYLDDGTMIVIEDGISYLGQTIPVVVTSVLQTSAGKMIFVKCKE